MRRRRLICLAAAALALLTAGAGQAAPPQELRTNPSAEAVPAAPDKGGGLPFSGLDLALLLAGGGPLVLIGVSLRRRRPKPVVKTAQEETLTLA
jgi:hypothetical protein